MYYIFKILNLFFERKAFRSNVENQEFTGVQIIENRIIKWNTPEEYWIALALVNALIRTLAANSKVY